MSCLRIANSLALFLVLACPGVMAAEQGTDGVRVTPLGSHAGEFCRFDRALLFEDPNGTRILYDAGRTVAGPDDPRLGRIDLVLVSHMHGDHVGDRRLSEPGAGQCDQPDMGIDSTRLTNSVEIAHGKGAKILTGSEMPAFFAKKLEAAGGNPKDSLLVRFGASHDLAGIKITTVPASHSNGIAGPFIGGRLGELLEAAGVSAYAGPATGYVVTFSNGLVVYLSGDTGLTAEQKSVVAEHYRAKLVVINIGDTFTTGPREAAFVVNEWIKPTSVIASHANEAATRQGKVQPGTRTAAFIAAAEMPVVVPLSQRTLTFDGEGRCMQGCDRDD